jgi:hypothetical protein
MGAYMSRLSQEQPRYDTQGGEIVGTSFELEYSSYVYFLVVSYVKYIRGKVGQSLQLLSYNDPHPNYQLIAYSSICERGSKDVSDSRVSTLLYLPPGKYSWQSVLLYSEALGDVRQIGSIEYSQPDTSVHLYAKGDGELYTTISCAGLTKNAIGAQRVDFGMQSPGTVTLQVNVRNQSSGTVMQTPVITRAGYGMPSLVTGALPFIANAGERMLIEAISTATQKHTGSDNDGLRTLDISPH